MKNFLMFDKYREFDKWYKEICQKAVLIDYGLVKGTIILEPFALKIWNNIKKEFYHLASENSLELDEIKLPALIPYSYFKKESEHFKGFLPEVLQIRNIANKELADPLVLRPTSEISFCNYFKNKLKTHRDLPMQYIQWCNIFRWEYNTKALLRNSEFYWQEGHALYQNKLKSEEGINKINRIYLQLLNETCLLYSISGKKSENEKFFGANKTYTNEIFLPNGYALQCATSHDLANNFTKGFEIKFHGTDNKYYYPFQTSWGYSTRILGGIIIQHSDNNGLILPTKIAPYKIAIIIKKNNNQQLLNTIYRNLQNRISYNPQISKKLAILQGYPLIIEFDSNSNNTIKLITRYNLVPHVIDIKNYNLMNEISHLLKESDIFLAQKAKNEFVTKLISNCTTKKEFIDSVLKNQIIQTHFCGNNKEELEIKNTTTATIRTIKIDNATKNSKILCFWCGSKAKYLAIFAKSY